MANELSCREYRSDASGALPGRHWKLNYWRFNQPIFFHSRITKRDSLRKQQGEVSDGNRGSKA